PPVSRSNLREPQAADAGVDAPPNPPSARPVKALSRFKPRRKRRLVAVTAAAAMVAAHFPERPPPDGEAEPPVLRDACPRWSMPSRVTASSTPCTCLT